MGRVRADPAHQKGDPVTIETTKAADAKPRPDAPPREATSAGTWLVIWMSCVIALQGAAWVTGFRGYVLAEAVERGAARAEASRTGEVSDEVIRKAVRMQQDTLPFWTALAALGDFGAEPILIAVRAALVATIFAGVAALTGRPIRFADGLAACAFLQGLWVLGLATRVVLMIALRRTDVETSAALLLPPGAYPAAVWVSLRQVEPFAIWGWCALAVSGWRRGQVNLATASLVCLLLAVMEAGLRIGYTLVVGAGIRLSLLPG
jgi:hypothetical protein